MTWLLYKLSILKFFALNMRYLSHGVQIEQVKKDICLITGYLECNETVKLYSQSLFIGTLY